MFTVAIGYSLGYTLFYGREPSVFDYTERAFSYGSRRLCTFDVIHHLHLYRIVDPMLPNHYQYAACVVVTEEVYFPLGAEFLPKWLRRKKQGYDFTLGNPSESREAERIIQEVAQRAGVPIVVTEQKGSFSTPGGG